MNDARQPLAASDKGSWYNQEFIFGLQDEDNPKRLQSASARKILAEEENESGLTRVIDLFCSIASTEFEDNNTKQNVFERVYLTI